MKNIFILLYVLICSMVQVFGADQCRTSLLHNNLNKITNICNNSEEENKRNEKNIVEHLFNKLIDNIIDVRIVKGQNRQCIIQSHLCQDNEIGRVITSVMESLDNNIGMTTEQIVLPNHLINHSMLDEVLAIECKEAQASLDHFCRYTREKEEKDRSHAMDIAKGLGYSIMVKRVDDQKERARNRDELIKKYRCLQMSQLGSGSNLNSLDNLMNKYIDKKNSTPSVLREALKEIRTKNTLGNNYLDSVKTNVRQKLAMPEVNKTIPAKTVESLMSKSASFGNKSTLPMTNTSANTANSNASSISTVAPTSKVGSGYGSVGGNSNSAIRQSNNNGGNVFSNSMDTAVKNREKSVPTVQENAPEIVPEETQRIGQAINQRPLGSTNSQNEFNSSRDRYNSFGESGNIGNTTRPPDLDDKLKNTQSILLGIDPEKRKPFEQKEAAERKFKSDCISENKVENDPKNAGKLSKCISKKMDDFYEILKIKKISELLKYQIVKSLK